LTSGQRNALRAAENYLELMGMSKAGLIQQLSSPAGDGYSKADATYAANHVKANWNAEAVEAAKNYMELMPMSRAGLIQQLSSSAGDEFTKAQATHAADAVL
jgi:predicted 3-demethylubiquinone-9 3-methyltransferase (glyoxalase superfamily)